MRRLRFQNGFGRNKSGVAAIEFAMILPVMLLLMFGGYAIAEAVMLSRKVTITTRALADLTSQYASLSATDISTILNASSQVIAPFATSPMWMRLSEVRTDATGANASVVWSKAVNTTDYLNGAPVTLPVAMRTPNTYYILSEVTYSYAPLSVYGLVGPFTISDNIFMLPRISTDIPCPSC